ncbi:MAG: twin-arginine translocase TatA/TatE family subunit [Clostridia bacterium]|nr:twin-arginine translocase TatA/TatE family subunit [Clostridia bacterium]
MFGLLPFNIGATELIAILVIALVIFGPGKLPELGKSLGSAIKEFRKSTSEIKKELEDTNQDSEKRKQKRKKYKLLQV